MPYEVVPQRDRNAHCFEAALMPSELAQTRLRLCHAMEFATGALFRSTLAVTCSRPGEPRHAKNRPFESIGHSFVPETLPFFEGQFAPCKQTR